MKVKENICVFAVLILLAIVGINSLLNYSELNNERPIIQDVVSLTEECKKIGDRNFPLSTKCLIWNVQKNERDPAYDALDNSLKATSSDKQITVFLITGTRLQEMGTYSISHEPAYRQYVDIAVISWPDKTPLAFKSLISYDPPTNRKVTYTPGYGDTSAPIANWIKTMYSSK